MKHPPSPRSGKILLSAVALVAVVAATIGILLLLENIRLRKAEAKQTVFQVVAVPEGTVDPEIWGRNFPKQYDSYKRTVDIERTRHGGSEAFQHLDEDPVWKVIFKGYAFGVDYREERGHAYMLADQDETERVTQFKQPGACLHCHSSIMPAYAKAGKEAGAPEGDLMAQVMKGFEVICPMPIADARKLVDHPVSCVDCHDPASMRLRVSRPGFINGMKVLAESADPLPHMPSVERWRKGDRKEAYDPNELASRQEMRSFVCGQCHVEYYFAPPNKLVTYPWHNGLKMEQAEAYYDKVGHKDFVQTDAGSPVLKAQHPEFELWSQGVHARSGVSCADCHMPYIREGAVKISDHHVRSPLLNINNACQTCHPYPEAEILARATTIQDRTKALLDRGENAVLDLIQTIAGASAAGATDEQLKAARDFHRKAQWRLDYVSAENSMGFHAPQESARILAEVLDFSRLGLKAMPAGAAAASAAKTP